MKLLRQHFQTVAWISLLFFLSFTFFSFSANAQTSPQSLNSGLLRALAAWQGSNGNAQIIAGKALQNAAAQRQAKLAALMETDPGAVLAAALPDDVARQLPASAQNSIEKKVRVRGTADVTIEDGHTYSKIHYGLIVAGKRLALHFAGNPPHDLQTGVEAEFEGVVVGEAMATNGSSTTNSPSTDGSSQGLPNTLGAQNTAVILVNFQDEVLQPFTPDFAYGTIFTNSYSVNGYMQENSFQQTWLTGNVYGWYTIPVSYTVCDTASIANYAKQAAQNAGVDLSPYKRFVYIFPNNACSWWGYSNIGGSPSNTWIRDYTNSTSGVKVLNISHELGHALGLYHSHALNCGSVPYADSGCSSIEYGDTIDFMGNANYVSGGHYNSFQKERLGWLNANGEPPIQSVSSSGTYTIVPYESQDSGVKGLKLLQSSTNNTYYYIEFRQALGYDSFLSSGYTEVTNGVLVHKVTSGSGNSSNLLNMVPSVTNWTSPALQAGQTYTDSTNGITIKTSAVNSSAATVDITLSGPACTLANPSVSISGPSGSVPPGSTVAYTVTVKDNDSSNCGSATFNLTYAIPSGWTGSYSQPSLTLSPGGSGSSTLSVTSPSNAADGTYTIKAIATNAANSSYSGSASTNETIYTPLNVAVSVSTGSSSYKVGQTVTVNTKVTSNGNPVSGASVAVVLTKSNGNLVNQSATTGTNGVATTTYRLKKNDPKGSWKAQGTADNTSANTSFTVQ